MNASGMGVDTPEASVCERERPGLTGEAVTLVRRLRMTIGSNVLRRREA